MIFFKQFLISLIGVSIIISLASTPRVVPLGNDESNLTFEHEEEFQTLFQKKGLRKSENERFMLLVEKRNKFLAEKRSGLIAGILEKEDGKTFRQNTVDSIAVLLAGIWAITMIVAFIVGGVTKHDYILLVIPLLLTIGGVLTPFLFLLMLAVTALAWFGTVIIKGGWPNQNRG